MDIGDTIAPDSTQLDAVDLLAGARTFTIAGVSKGTADQPVQITLDGFPRPWRPGKSMRRVLVACWGRDASTYVGRKVVLFCDPEVRFGGQAVGGIRVSHLSHIDKPKSIPLLISRGQSKVFTVQPLKEDAPPPPDTPEPTAEEVAACADMEQLRAMWRATRPNTERREQVKARMEALADKHPTLDSAS